MMDLILFMNQFPYNSYWRYTEFYKWQTTFLQNYFYFENTLATF